MQILNISVMNRGAKFLTTVPYPLITVSSFDVGVSVPSWKLELKTALPLELLQVTASVPTWTRIPTVRYSTYVKEPDLLNVEQHVPNWTRIIAVRYSTTYMDTTLAVVQGVPKWTRQTVADYQRINLEPTLITVAQSVPNWTKVTEV